MVIGCNRLLWLLAVRGWEFMGGLSPLRPNVNRGEARAREHESM